MNPLQLKGASRQLYNALVDLHHTEAADDEWLPRYRKVKRIIKTEEYQILEGWRCFYKSYIKSGIPIEIAENWFVKGMRTM